MTELNEIRCPECNKRHVDVGRWAVLRHKDHLCLYCGHNFEAEGFGEQGSTLEKTYAAGFEKCFELFEMRWKPIKDAPTGEVRPLNRGKGKEVDFFYPDRVMTLHSSGKVIPSYLNQNGDQWLNYTKENPPIGWMPYPKASQWEIEDLMEEEEG